MEIIYNDSYGCVTVLHSGKEYDYKMHNRELKVLKLYIRRGWIGRAFQYLKSHEIKKEGGDV